MGIPRLLMTDNGKEFSNQFDTKLSKLLGFTTPYHPQVNQIFIKMYCMMLLFKQSKFYKHNYFERTVG